MKDIRIDRIAGMGRMIVYHVYGTRNSHGVSVFRKGQRKPDDSPVFGSKCEAMEFVRLQRVADTLNDQHERFAAGFYGSLIGGRFFKARIIIDCNVPRLEVYDWEHWHRVENDKIKFHDHNGREIILPVA